MTLLDVVLILLWLGLGLGMAFSKKVSTRQRLLCLLLAPLVFAMVIGVSVRVSTKLSSGEDKIVAHK